MACVIWALKMILCNNFGVKYVRITLLLSHTLTHLTGQRPNYCPIIFFRCYVNLHKSCSKLQTSDFQSQFSTSKIIWIFLTFFHWRISMKEHTLFSKMMVIFWLNLLSVLRPKIFYFVVVVVPFIFRIFVQYETFLLGLKDLLL